MTRMIMGPTRVISIADLGRMLLIVVMQEMVEEPLVGFRGRVRLMKMKERLEALSHGPKAAFHLPLRTGGRPAPAALLRGVVHLDLNPELLCQHPMEDA